MPSYSIRYGGYGGIAYHHVSDTYIALFSHFIPCGVWEAIYILEGLLKNTSDIQPTTVHADTQGQSTPVHALSFLLGIKLMPRIRNWKDLRVLPPEQRREVSTHRRAVQRHCRLAVVPGSTATSLTNSQDIVVPDKRGR
jgi:TnpA family transposase